MNGFNTAFFDSTATNHTALTNIPVAGSVANVIKNATSFSAQISSSVSAGTAPISVTSTTPCTNLHANPVAYNHSGGSSSLVAGGKMAFGSSTLSGGSVTVTLTGNAVFSGSNSYVVTATDTTAANAVKVAITSGSQFTLTGTGTDVIFWTAIGN
jgi:hypothetical protein